MTIRAAHTPMQLAARAHLLETVIATTGSTTLAATANGYTRAAGSFIADGFVPGLEIEREGFSSNVIDIITWVSDDGDEIRTANSHAVQVAGAGRSLIAIPPRAIHYGARKPTDVDVAVPYWHERWLGGPSRSRSTFFRGAPLRTTTDALYEINLYGRVNDEDIAVTRPADAIFGHFNPSSTALDIGTGEAMTVRTSPLPMIGQPGRDADGRPTIQVTISLRATYMLEPAS